MWVYAVYLQNAPLNLHVVHKDTYLDFVDLL